MRKLRFISMFLLLGLGLGVAFQSMDVEMLKQFFQWKNDEPQLVLPENGVKTDEWSLSIFKLMAEQNPTGFVFSPIGLNIALQDIQATADDETTQAIAAMNLPDIDLALDVTVPATGFSKLVLDESVITKQDNVLKLPLLVNRADAFNTLNRQMIQSIKNEFDYPIMNSLISRQAKLLGFTLIHQPMVCLHPFQQDAGNYINFDIGQGRNSILNALHIYAPLRYIETDDYGAFAFFLKAERESENISCMLIIMPKYDELSDFIKRLSSQELNRIKSELIAQNEAVEVYFKIPAFQSLGQTISLRPLLESLGLGAIFTDNAKFTALTDEEIKLENLWHSANFELKAGEKQLLGKQLKEERPIMLEINRPFIWVVGDLTRGECPSLMGSVHTL